MAQDEDSGFNEHIARLVTTAKTDGDYRRINELLAGGPQGFAQGGDIAVGYQRGGEAKISEARRRWEESKKVPPAVYNVHNWATRLAEDMYPREEDLVKRDAARHMLASAVMADKVGGSAAEMLGRLHEFKEAPLRTAGHWLGVSNPRPDYPTDTFNNALGVELKGLASNPMELQKAIRGVIDSGRAKLVSDEGTDMQGYGVRPVEPPIARKDGGEVSDEPTAEERERASKAAFGVTPSSGKGRKQSRVSEALQSGEAQLAAAKGMTMLPQNLMGSGVDIATMLMRPFGYNVEKPVGGSDYLKEKSRQAGVAFQEPEDPTLRAFFRAGDISSNLVNPAGATRTAARGVEKTGQAAKELAEFATRPVERDPFFAGRRGAQRGAVRPPGGGVPALPETTPSSSNAISNMESWLAEGMEGAKRNAPNSEVADAIRNFWQTKATNYVTRQMGTPDDPIFKQIMSGSLTTPQLEKEFRGYMLEQTKVGKTKVNPATGEERFYPKFPEATEDLTRKYDVMTGITPMVISTRPDLVSEGAQWLGGKADALAAQKQEDLISKLVAAGVPIGQINVPRVNVAAPLASGNLGSTTFQSSVPKALLEGTQFQGPQKGGRQQSSEAIRRAIANEEPIYDIQLQSPLKEVLTPPYINEYLATLSPKEIAKTRFEDVVKDSAKYRLKKFERETLVQDIKSGRPVKEKFFAEGVSAPLLQIQEGPLAGFAWKRIEDAESTVPEGAYVGHSVGGYAKGGAYGPEKHKLFNEGKYQVYTLRDNRNRPVTTVEVKVEDKMGPVVTQVKGNGRATGNTAPVNYDAAVEQFFRDYLKPVGISESNDYLTPRLQQYKLGLVEEHSRKATEQHLRELYPNAD